MNSLLEIMAALEAFLGVDPAHERLMDAAALAKAQQLRQSGEMPQITYRCQQRRCGHLFKAWNTPAGVLFWHPAIRIGESRMEKITWSGGDSRLYGDRRTPSGAQVWPERAYLWQGQNLIFVACEHQWARLGPAEIRDSLALALRTGHTVKRVAPTDSASVG